jgi:cysteinyl-tRNA synthetase
MIHEYLGENFDLHSGGVDLVFPHHENEIAQSRCACGGDFAAHWFHITHLLVDGGKMSKSLGNLYTLDDLAAKGFTAMDVRYVLIGAHYRKPLNFTLDSLTAAREALQRLAKGARGLAARVTEGVVLDEVGFGPFQGAWDALENDLNTPGALGGLFTGLREAAGLEGVDAARALAGMNRILRALGIVLPEAPAEVVVPEGVRALAEERWAARLAKDWAKTDALRTEITAAGWKMNDGKEVYTLEPLG